MHTLKNSISGLLILFLSFSVATHAQTEQVFFDDFETSQGWTEDPYGTDDATTGTWERANPEETSYSGSLYQLGTTQSGSYDLVTGGSAGSSVGTYDIDGGKTSIRSPDIDLPSGATITISLYYYFAHYSNSSSDDYIHVKIVDAGSHNTLLEVLNELGSGSTSGASWQNISQDISGQAGETVYILVEAADDAGGSLVEAGVDDVLIESETNEHTLTLNIGENGEVEVRAIDFPTTRYDDTVSLPFYAGTLVELGFFPVSDLYEPEITPDLSGSYAIWMDVIMDGDKSFTINFVPNYRKIDSLALVALYNSTDGPNWNNNTNWLTNQPIDTWFGIKLVNNRVDSLNLDGNQLSGNIPPELGNLTKLQFLIVGNNNLTGPIPPELGNLVSLKKLYFQKNNISGTIPSELFSLNSLQTLYLASNELSGSIPAEIGNLVNLKVLGLYFNQLSGPIPPQIGSLISLDIFAINDNELSGNIPSTIGNLTSLTLFHINNNQFTNLPSEIVNLTPNPNSGCNIGENKFCTLFQEVITWANTYDNDWASTQTCPPPQIQITADPQSGDVPLTVNFTATNIGQSNIDTWSWIFGDGGTSTEQNPTHTYTSSGTFNAQVTATGIGGSTTESITIEAINALREQDSLALVALYYSISGLSWNLGSPMETWHGVTITSDRVTNFTLNEEELSGTIAPEIVNLTELVKLSLMDNTISGTIPAEIGNLTNLVDLLLQGNQLTGSIPPELGNLNNLVNLNLSRNQLTGSIPPELGNLLLEEAFFNLSNNQLTGPVPSTFGKAVNLGGFFINNNQLTDLPEGIVNLNPEGANLNYNRFCQLSPAVVAWANQHGGTWASTQDCPPPEIQITADPQSGPAPLTVNFTATNIGQSNIDTWSWVFGDGGTSTEQNPTHIYNTAGTYNAQVTATGIGGSTTESVTIEVLAAPSITISATPQSGIAPLTVSFTATNSGGPVDTWSWTFGDGGTSTEQNPIHTYDAIGSYNAQVTATGPGGSDVKSITIDVLDDPREIDSLALVALYNSTDGANWTNNTNWLTLEPIDTWYGITVFQNRVIYIDLNNNQLSGGLPAELVNLTNIQSINLSLNQLVATIPPEMGSLTNLYYLSLSTNQLTGDLPPELSNLVNLRNLYISNNQLTGIIPSEFGNLTSLQNLSLDNNQLTGSIPPELANLVSLNNLYLYNNQLTGNIPSELGSLTALQRINLSNNQLTGAIPSELGNITSLRVIYLSSNQLTDAIPSELGNLINLQSISLAGNQLTGAIPPELGSLTSLQGLYLTSNQLTGTIPSEFGNLINLQHLNLATNQLTGAIPSEIGGLPELLELGLQVNQLTDEVPGELGNLTQLQQFFIHYNQFTNFSEEIVNLNQLLSCDFGNNQFCTLSPAVVTWANQYDPDWATTQDCPPPEIDITATPQTGPVPLTVNFTATNIGQSNIDTWSWVFGDGGTSTEQNPTHIYNTAGTFTAQVTATGIGGSTTESIIITPIVAPAVSITANPRSGEAPLTVTFTANNTGGPVATWHWDFGDGDTSDVQNPSLHTYTSVGTYLVVLTAINAAGASADTVLIEALPATATLTMTITGQGTTSPSPGDTQVVQGEDVPISATPAAGYEFVEWGVTAGSATIVAPTQSATTAQLSGDATINAGFALMDYTLTVTSGLNGTTVPSGAIPAQHRVPIAVAATPDPGFKFALWTVENGTATIENPTLANTNIILESGDAEVLASFIEDAGAVPYNRMLSITGTLYDDNGDPVGYPDPVDIDATIRLTTEENGGDTVYTESFYEDNGEAVTVDNGLFVARLGSGTSANDLQAVLSAYENLFVEITVEELETPDVLLPRTPLTAGAFTLTGPPVVSELNLNTIHGSGDPNDADIQGRVGIYYIDNETGMTWLRINSKWILLE